MEKSFTTSGPGLVMSYYYCRLVSWEGSLIVSGPDHCPPHFIFYTSHVMHNLQTSHCIVFSFHFAIHSYCVNTCIVISFHYYPFSVVD